MSERSALTIERARIFDPRTDEVREASIHIADGAIVAIGGEAPDTDRPDTDRAVVDAAGRLVTPGLIDAHFHANACGLDLLEIEASPASYVAAAARQRLERALRRGFTTVRDVAGGDLGLVRALDEGLIDGPRYLFAGARPHPDRRPRRPSARRPRPVLRRRAPRRDRRRRRQPAPRRPRATAHRRRT